YYPGLSPSAAGALPIVFPKLSPVVYLLYSFTNAILQLLNIVMEFCFHNNGAIPIRERCFFVTLFFSWQHRFSPAIPGKMFGCLSAQTHRWPRLFVPILLCDRALREWF